MDSLQEINHLLHTIIGTLAFIGGIIALATKKGSKPHKTGGVIFFVGMLYAAISVIGFMIEEFRPLAVLMSVATIYLMFSSIAALRHRKKYARIIDMTFIVFPLLLFAMTMMRVTQVLPEISLATFTPLLLAVVFAIVLIRDIKLIRKRPTDALFFVRRHAFRMILAFGFAIMAVLRIGIKLDFLGLEFSTFAPMLLALIAAFYVEKNIEKIYPVKRKE